MLSVKALLPKITALPCEKAGLGLSFRHVLVVLEKKSWAVQPKYALREGDWASSF